MILSQIQVIERDSLYHLTNFICALFLSPFVYLPHEPPHPQNLEGTTLPFLITHRKIISKSRLFCHLKLIHSLHLDCCHLTQAIT